MGSYLGNGTLESETFFWKRLDEKKGMKIDSYRIKYINVALLILDYMLNLFLTIS